MTDLQALAHAATETRGAAYVPYTKFDAAAAVRWEAASDEDAGPATGIALGVVVENVSLGLAMCAERSALFSAVAAGGRPTHLALSAPATRDGVTMPCGACLQVALELGGPDLVVVSVDPNSDDLHEATVSSLLPEGPYTGPH
ncbi:MAG: cytidine deaminase [Acidimicrobiales bacterium]